MPGETKSTKIGSHLFRLEASLWESMHQILYGILVKAEGIHKVLSIAAYSEFVTLPEVSGAWINVTCSAACQIGSHQTCNMTEIQVDMAIDCA